VSRLAEYRQRAPVDHADEMSANGATRANWEWGGSSERGSRLAFSSMASVILGAFSLGLSPAERLAQSQQFGIANAKRLLLGRHMCFDFLFWAFHSRSTQLERVVSS